MCRLDLYLFTRILFVTKRFDVGLSLIGSKGMKYFVFFSEQFMPVDKSSFQNVETM